ncbi:hypothetical protein [Gloeocapsopsis dulcis]|uniref:hypothetical protein n=1 Tax=Gloeocapsopsis dulcis TaxID=2859516 RepID=UPI0012DAE629|nr:hypothetical protein [Gloeocapsopsis dulcis]WNN89574.1 hypothetical protein P0S91_00275 [Gloeocapsopsis dulcis]
MGLQCNLLSMTAIASARNHPRRTDYSSRNEVIKLAQISSHNSVSLDDQVSAEWIADTI